MISPVTYRFHCNVLAAIGLMLAASGLLAQPTGGGELTLPTGAPFRFFAIGDQGQVGEIQRTCAARAVELQAKLRETSTPASLLLFLGDNFYPNGLNRPPAIQRWLIDQIMTPYQPLLTELGRERVHAISGNHDFYCTAINQIPLGICRGGNLVEQDLPSWTYTLYWPRIIRNAISAGSADSVDIIAFDSSVLLAVGPMRCRMIFDSLEATIRKSGEAPSVKWRLLAAHHSPYYIGEHGGWRRWIASENRIGYIGNCVSDGDDPFRYIYQAFSNQDNCSPDYRAYIDSLKTRVERAGVKIQAMLAGHDHSLQLMYYPDRGAINFPKVFIVSGAASKRATVKSPNPPQEFSHPINTPEEKGQSVPGFALCSFENDEMILSYYDNTSIDPLDMGGGRTRFVVTRSGELR
jgi:hypothetical protein